MDISVLKATEQESIELFCCYADKDSSLFLELENHLIQLKRDKYINLWSAIDITAGLEQQEELYRHLNSAQVILLLVSPDFIASNSCYDIEQRALERHKRGEARVIPIILRPVDWIGGPLGKLQALPNNGKPVTGLDWHDHDSAFYDVAKEIRKVIEQLMTNHSPALPIAIEAEEQETTQVESTYPTIHQWSTPSSLIPSTEIEKLVLLGTLTDHTMAIHSVTLSPDGRTLVSGSADKTIKIWNLTTGQLTHTLNAHKNIVHTVAMSIDGRTLVSGSADKTIKVWNLTTGQLTHTLNAHKSSIFSVGLSVDGQTLVSGSADKTIKVWNLHTGQVTRTLLGHIDMVSCVAISASGRTLVSGDYNNTIKIWNLDTGQFVQNLTGHTGIIWSITISPDERLLACGCVGGVIKVWNMFTGQIVHTLTDHSTSVMSVAISADGRTLFSGSDNTIKVWDLSTGQRLRTLTGHAYAVYSVAISADKHTLASGSYDNTIKVWRA